MTKPSKDGKATSLPNLEAMCKRLGIREVDPPKGWARAIIQIPQDLPEEPEEESETD